MGILIEQVSKRFGTQRVLDRVSLEVAPGEMFVLLGASGSGKSTLLRLVAGLSMPDRGRIALAGRDVTALKPQERGTGFVFQNYSVFRHMTVAQNIEFGMRLRRVPRAERARRRDQLLELVGLPGFASREAAELSGGQQQRVAIARALAYEPKVLLLDEPFGALDVKIRTQLRRSLRRIHDRLRITTLLVTHDQEEAFELADRVGLMDRGRLVEVGRAEDLYARPRSLFAATFLGSGTVLMGRVERGRARFEGLDLEVAPQVPHEDGSRAHLLIRPEDLQVSAAPAAGGETSLGSGAVVDQSFAGALRRVRIRLARRAEVHPASSPPSTPEGVVVEALVPSHQPLPDHELWVSLQRWHFLDPPPASLLMADDAGAPFRSLELARDVARALGAQVTVLGVAADVGQADRLGRRIGRRAIRAGLGDAELRVRYGNPATQILQEQAELGSQMIVTARRDGRFAWLATMGLGRGASARIGRTIVSLLENARVPVLVAAGGSATLRRITVVMLGPAGASEPLRDAARFATALRASLVVVEIDAEEAPSHDVDLAVDALAGSGVAIEARHRLPARDRASLAERVLDVPSDLVVAPVLRHGPHEVNEIFPEIAALVARADRPVLLVPAAREA